MIIPFDCLWRPFVNRMVCVYMCFSSFQLSNFRSDLYIGSAIRLGFFFLYTSELFRSEVVSTEGYTYMHFISK